VLAGRLARRLGQQMGASAPAIRRIDPVWHADPAVPTHFAGLSDGAPFTIAHLGTASHGGALARLAPVVTQILARHPLTSFTYVAPASADPLAGVEQARRIAPRSWGAWRRWLAGQGFTWRSTPCRMNPSTARDPMQNFGNMRKLVPLGSIRRDGPRHLLGEGALRAGPDAQEWGAGSRRQSVRETGWRKKLGRHLANCRHVNFVQSSNYSGQPSWE
jgi:hypothetical protein